MKIDEIGINALTNTVLEPRKTKPAPDAKEQVAETGKAFDVHMSEAVRQMIQAMPDEDEVRREKVAAIRDQLASGSYNISGKDVASKMLDALKA